MRCPDDEKFALYAEGNLNEKETSEFLEHLCGCQECSALYAMVYGKDESINACPEEELIAGLVEGKISQSQQDDLLKHMAVCKTCSAEIYILRKLKPAKKSVKPKHSVRVMFKTYRLLAAAAVIALVLGGLAGMQTVPLVPAPASFSVGDRSAMDALPQETPQPPDQVPAPIPRGLVNVTPQQSQLQVPDLGIATLSPATPRESIQLSRTASLGIRERRQAVHLNAQRLLNSGERPDWEQAYVLYTELAESYDDDYLAAFMAGEAARKLGNNESAKKWYDRALAINPNYQPAINARAKLN